MIKKQLIMDKALELFAKQGFDATSIQQITDVCGISKGAFYLSFKSKEELIYALIDSFMMQYVSDIDHLVRDADNSSRLLYNFYYAAFNHHGNRVEFAKFIMKEHFQSFSKDLLMKLRHYDQMNSETIGIMLERIYGDTIKHTRYDLIFCIKSFIKTYSELLIFYEVSLDIHLLAQSLAEKTDLLVKHSTIPFISEELVRLLQQPICKDMTKDELLDFLDQKIIEMEDSTAKDSLILLKGHLLEPHLHPAIVKGLLENIRNHPQCKWACYLIRSYLNI